VKRMAQGREHVRRGVKITEVEWKSDDGRIREQISRFQHESHVQEIVVIHVL